MATITKVTRKSGTSWKAIIRRDNQSISKCFQYKKHAQKWAADQEQLIDAQGAGINTNSRTMTFSQLADLYMEQWTGKDMSRGAQLARWTRYLGTIRLGDITQTMIKVALKDYQSGSAQRGDGVGANGRAKLATTGKPRTPATVNRFKAALGACLTYARREEFMQHNPMENVPALKEPKGRIRWLTDDEQGRLLAACGGADWPRLPLLVNMALMTGARQGELMKLRWSDISFQEQTIQLLETKNGTDRTVPLAAPLAEMLKPLREIGGGLVFPSTRKPNKPFEFRKHWNKAVSDAGLIDFRFHDCRHHFCSMLAKRGVQMKLIAELAGHKSITTTQIYTHLDMDSKREAVEAMAGSIAR